MKNTSTPYTFSACRCAPAGNPAMKCEQEGFRMCRDNPYARLYVVTQKYDNLACPGYALRNGTFFNDLYMPYVPDCARKLCCSNGGERK